MNLPDFLIIGAMKCATTGLFRDLARHPGIFPSGRKEPGNLCSDHVLTEAGLQQYAALFSRAAANQLKVEASTHYTKLPFYTGVPQRTKRILGSQAKFIYIIREPISRIISHHYHNYCAGKASADIDVEVRRDPTYCDYSRYAMQITPWLETFGESRCLIILFEEYVSQRARVLQEVCEFLGVSAILPLGSGVPHNASGDMRFKPKILVTVEKRIRYGELIRPYLPSRLRTPLRRLLLGLKAPSKPAPPSPDTLNYILNELNEDMQQLRVLAGRDEPLWDEMVIASEQARSVM